MGLELGVDVASPGPFAGTIQLDRGPLERSVKVRASGRYVSESTPGDHQCNPVVVYTLDAFEVEPVHARVVGVRRRGIAPR